VRASSFAELGKLTRTDSLTTSVKGTGTCRLGDIQGQQHRGDNGIHTSRYYCRPSKMQQVVLQAQLLMMERSVIHLEANHSQWLTSYPVTWNL